MDCNPTCFGQLLDYLCEVGISSADHSPALPHVDEENTDLLAQLLEFFGFEAEADTLDGTGPAAAKAAVAPIGAGAGAEALKKPGGGAAAAAGADTDSSPDSDTDSSPSVQVVGEPEDAQLDTIAFDTSSAAVNRAFQREYRTLCDARDSLHELEEALDALSDAIA